MGAAPGITSVDMYGELQMPGSQLQEETGVELSGSLIREPQCAVL